jgi:hypothetical protein
MGRESSRRGRSRSPKKSKHGGRSGDRSGERSRSSRPKGSSTKKRSSSRSPKKKKATSSRRDKHHRRRRSSSSSSSFSDDGGAARRPATKKRSRSRRPRQPKQQPRQLAQRAVLPAGNASKVPWAPPLQHVGVDAWARDVVCTALELPRSDDSASSNSDSGESDDYTEGSDGRRRKRKMKQQRREAKGFEDEVVVHYPPPPPPSIHAGGPFSAQRRYLPVAQYRDELLSKLRALGSRLPGQPRASCCLVVEGETGSGKSTQVPQFILEDAALRRESVKIIVTQPRRIAAVGVAERVAAERGEEVGGVVGYVVRGQSAVNKQTCLVFETTGIALRSLQENELSDATHVIVDEVHERSLESDFLLLALRHFAVRVDQQGCFN